MTTLVRRACLLALVMIGAAALAVWITPRSYMADQPPRGKLVDIIPKSFGKWVVDESIVPIPPSPDLQQVIDATYDETVALTYRNAAGQRVMLSLAYGRNQHKGMNTHRPEICYPAQGFKIVRGSTPTTLKFEGRPIAATQVVAAMGARNEPITYWLLVGERITKFGYPQRATTIRYGLSGLIPDGVLVRVSSIDQDTAAAFTMQAAFIDEFLAAIPNATRSRLLGST